MTAPDSRPPLRLDRADVLGPLRRALRNERIVLDRWSIAPLGGGFAESTGGIVRLSGVARDLDASSELPWTLVLKEIVPPLDLDAGGRDNPDQLGYWRLEPLAYASGLLDDLPGGLVAPRCYGVEECPDRRYRLWLEDVGPDSERWTPEAYARAARHLGAFNGAYLERNPGARRYQESELGTRTECVPGHRSSSSFRTTAVTTCDLPNVPWLNRDYLRKYLAVSPHEAACFAGLRDPATWRFPRAREAFPTARVERLLGLWSRYPDLITAADRLPRTLCHLDPHRRNLLPRLEPDGVWQTVAIDWAVVGLACPGADAAQLAVATLVFDEVEGASPRDFAELVFESYVEGLRDAGWRGTRDAVRLGFAAFAIVRWAINVAGLLLENLATADPAVPAATAAWLGQPIERILPRWQGLVAYLLELAEELS